MPWRESRHRSLRILTSALIASVVLACSGAIGCRADGHSPEAGTGGAVAPSIGSSRRTAIVTAAERASPAVVSVSVVTTRVVRADPFGGMLHDEFFQRFYPPTEFKQRIPGLGSGVIVDASGLILTNEHVVHDAENITVTLSDGRQLPATLLGSSATYDLAVLRVHADKIPVAPFGNSDELMVGEWAIAIGNPFGFLLNDTQPTVTAGVISATKRDIKSEVTENGVYKNMIQTDAAINPGNSGGPLVNGDGEVIGINTFILTQGGGGSLGIGFAIPINLARRVVDEIVKYGLVRPAWPGMQIQEITAAVAQRLGFSAPGGLVVSRVENGGPADHAGVKVGDRLLSVNGLAIHNMEDSQRGIYGAEVGDKVHLQLEREGRKFDVDLVLTEVPKETK
jgi:serine protease Do